AGSGWKTGGSSTTSAAPLTAPPIQGPRRKLRSDGASPSQLRRRSVASGTSVRARFRAWPPNDRVCRSFGARPGRGGRGLVGAAVAGGRGAAGADRRRLRVLLSGGHQGGVAGAARPADRRHSVSGQPP